ncbi:unnamed protein product, partial [Laminaria digitata]
RPTHTTERNSSLLPPPTATRLEAGVENPQEGFLPSPASKRLQTTLRRRSQGGRVDGVRKPNTPSHGFSAKVAKAAGAAAVAATALIAILSLVDGRGDLSVNSD